MTRREFLWELIWPWLMLWDLCDAVWAYVTVPDA